MKLFRRFLTKGKVLICFVCRIHTYIKRSRYYLLDSHQQEIMEVTVCSHRDLLGCNSMSLNAWRYISSSGGQEVLCHML